MVSSATPREFTVEHRYTDLGDVRLHYVEAGEGPLALLLHGFPEFWYSWRSQIPALVKAGFHVVAPEDMRGYNLSDKPQGVKDYRIGLSGQDVVRAIRACGEERERLWSATTGERRWRGWPLCAPPRAGREASDTQRSSPGALPRRVAETAPAKRESVRVLLPDPLATRGGVAGW